MRKRICWTLLLLSLVLTCPASALAQVVEWNLIWQDDGTMLETVQLEKTDLVLDAEGWKASADDQGNLILTRLTADWEAYGQRADRLPLKMEVSNYLLLQTAVINSENFSASPSGLYGQIASLPDAQISIKLPGIIRDHSADMVVDSQEAIWNLSRLDHITMEDLLLKVTIFNGLLLAILLVVVAVIIIGLLFLRSIRRVHKLIEEEYSLANIELEEVGDDITGTEEQKN